MNPQDQPTDQSERRHDSPTAPAATAPTPESAAPSLPTPALATPSQPAENFYQPNDTAFDYPSGPAAVPADLRMQSDDQEIVWTASEYVEHDKTPNWYLALVGITIVVTALVYLITRDLFNAGIVIIAAVIFGVASARQARQMEYAVNDHGVGIGRRFYPYGDFRSFSLVDEGPMHSIVLMPLKRFMPPMTLYYDVADEVRIGDVLAAHLPFAEHQHELTDRLMKKIRF